MEILDQMALVLKDHRLASRRWAELFRLVVQSEEIAFIPQGWTRFPSAARTVPGPRRRGRCFCWGPWKGVSRTPVSAGVFSDAERRLMISMGLPLYDSLEKLAVEERYLAYMAAVSPSEELFLSYASSDLSGGAKSPSSPDPGGAENLSQLSGDRPVWESFSDFIWSLSLPF